MQATTAVNRPTAERCAGQDVDLFLKVIRTCVSSTNRWIRLSDDFLSAAKYTKVFSSLRNVISTSKLQGAIYTAITADKTLVKAKACWQVAKYSKKIVSSVVWFINVAKDFGLVATQTVAWTVYMGVIQIPFQLLSMGASFWRMAKIYTIWCELKRQDGHIQQGLLEHNVSCCHQLVAYLERSQDRLIIDLQLKQPLVRSTNDLTVWLNSKCLEKQQMAIDQCEKLLQTLKGRVFAQVIAQVMACVSKVIDAVATVFESFNPAAFMYLTLLSMTATALKISRHFYAKSQVQLLKPANSLIQC
jgi:hypothetical protein